MGQFRDSSLQSDFQVLTVNTGFLLLGVFGWEYVQSFQVEYTLISGRLSFRSSLVPYILGRICLLMFLVLAAVGSSAHSEGIDCRPGLYTIAALGNIALGCSTTNFAIRTWVIWKNSRLVHGLLLLLALGQWAILILGVVVLRAANVNGSCVVFIDHPQVNVALLIYTMCYDLLVSVLSVVGLSRERLECPLMKRLRVQGIVYFAVAGISYIPCMIADLIGSSSISIIFSDIALTVGTIASSRAVRSLYTFDSSDNSGESLESSFALTTQIGIQSTTVPDVTRCGHARGVDRC